MAQESWFWMGFARFSGPCRPCLRVCRLGRRRLQVLYRSGPLLLHRGAFTERVLFGLSWLDFLTEPHCSHAFRTLYISLIRCNEKLKVIFLFLAMAYALEFFTADGQEDCLKERSQEAKEALQAGQEGWKEAFLRAFVAVFIAEWGDRTQVAMITLHSSAPWVPVCLGSLVAFLVLTLSAVLAARLLQQAKLSERVILAVSACSFLLFAALAFRDGQMESRAHHI